MGVDRVHVVPGVSRLNGVQVKFTSGHDGVRFPALHVVAIDVEGGREPVIAAYLLKLFEGWGDDGRVHQPDCRQRGCVGTQLPCAHTVHGLVVRDLNRFDSEGLSRRLDVVGYPGTFQVRFVGFDHETTNSPRIDSGEDHRGDHQQTHCDTRHTPPHPPRVIETQQRADRRDRGDNQTGRDPRGRIRIVDAREQVVLSGQVTVSVEERCGPVQQQRDPEQNGYLPLSCLAGPFEVPRLPEGSGIHGTGEEMHQKSSNEADHHHETHVVQHEPPPRQLEHVERRIQSENGVGGTEVGGANPCQEDLHLTSGDSTT